MRFDESKQRQHDHFRTKEKRMYKDEFIRKLAEIMEVDYQEIDVTTNLKELEEYDSLALIAIIAFIDENFAITIPADKLSTVTTVNTLIELIGLEKFK